MMIVKEEEISFQITVKYTDRDSKQCIQNYNYSFNDKENVFSSEAIENGLALYYYAQGFRKIAKLAVAIRDLIFIYELDKLGLVVVSINLELLIE